MRLTLSLDLPNAAQEAVWLNSRLNQTDIPGLESHAVVEQPAQPGTMDGGLVLGALAMAVTTVVVEKVVDKLLALLERQFDGKRADFVLTAECPGSGQTFSLTFNHTKARERAALVEEFKALQAQFCSPA